MLKFGCLFLSLFRQGIILTLTIITAFNLSLAIADQDFPQDISATSWRVVDGDTIHANGHKIRLLGIDTPEINQKCQTKDGAEWPCGKMARDLVVGMLDAKGTLWCRITGRDRYQRLLGQCFAGVDDKGMDIQHMLVRSGFAVAEYARTYRAQEAAAKRGEQGFWRGVFQRPKEWRRQNY